MAGVAKLLKQVQGKARLLILLFLLKARRVLLFVHKVFDKVFQVVGGYVEILQIYVGHVEILGEALQEVAVLIQRGKSVHSWGWRVS